MTREEAIEKLKSFDLIGSNEDIEFQYALDMGIEALEKIDKIDKIAHIKSVEDLNGLNCEETILGLFKTVLERCEITEDAISRQAAIVALDDRMQHLENVDMQIAMGFAKGIINDLPPVKPAEKPNKWIACSDRLPEAGEYIGNVAKYYLVQNEYGDMLVARYTHGEYWEQIYQLKPIGDEIVAWMPLPEPMKEGD